MPEEETLPTEENVAPAEEVSADVAVEGIPAEGSEEPPLPEGAGEGEEDDATVDNIIDAILELPPEVQMEIHQILMEKVGNADAPNFEDEAVVAEKQGELESLFL